MIKYKIIFFIQSRYLSKIQSKDTLIINEINNILDFNNNLQLEEKQLKLNNLFEKPFDFKSYYLFLLKDQNSFLTFEKFQQILYVSCFDMQKDLQFKCFLNYFGLTKYVDLIIIPALLELYFKTYPDILKEYLCIFLIKNIKVHCSFLTDENFINKLVFLTLEFVNVKSIFKFNVFRSYYFILFLEEPSDNNYKDFLFFKLYTKWPLLINDLQINLYNLNLKTKILVNKYKYYIYNWYFIYKIVKKWEKDLMNIFIMDKNNKIKNKYLYDLYVQKNLWYILNQYLIFVENKIEYIYFTENLFLSIITGLNPKLNLLSSLLLSQGIYYLNENEIKKIKNFLQIKLQIENDIDFECFILDYEFKISEFSTNKNENNSEINMKDLYTSLELEVIILLYEWIINISKKKFTITVIIEYLNNINFYDLEIDR